MQITPSEVSAQLAAQVESITRELLPNGKRIGSEWCVGSVGGEAGESCKVHLGGNKAGLWRDFSGSEKGGDLLDLWAAVRGCDLKTAIDQACAWLGIRRPEFHTSKKQEFKKPPKPEDTRSLGKADAVAKWLLGRGFSEKTLAAYKVAAKGPDAVMFPYLRRGELIHLKYRSIKEKKFWTSPDSEKCLFGWQVVDPSARSVVLTEGELDAMSMFQYGYAALSVPFGGGKEGKQDWIENEFENLEQFDTIYLALDSDEAGKLALYDIVDRLGRHRCKVVELPFKDANECLMKQVPRDAIIKAVGESKTLDPRELRNAWEYRDAVQRRFHPAAEQTKGFLLPWNKMANKFIFEWGCTSVLAGVNGHGKSQLVGQIVADAISQGVKCCAASLEFRPEKWLARLVRQLLCDPTPNEERIDKALDWVSKNLWAFDVSGRGMGTAKIDRLLEVFGYARARYGCRLMVVDNWSKLGIPEDGYSEQKAAMVAITEFAVEHDCHLLIVNHMRKTEDDSMAGGKMGIRGSGSLSDLPDNVFVAWRNRRKEARLKEIDAAMYKETESDKRSKLEEERGVLLEKPDAILLCEKYRNGEEEPRIALFFDKKSTQFLESRNDRPRGYC